MRRPNRTIEIFSMSVLDLFASALGGFILIGVILFPEYIKQVRAEHELEQRKAAVQEDQARLDRVDANLRAAELETQRTAVNVVECQTDQTQLQATLAHADELIRKSVGVPKELASCKAALAETFIVVTIDWGEAGPYDVDLHVTDPEGHEFYYGKSNRNRTDYPASEAQLSYDNRTGPGVELWQEPQARPGTYRVDYRYLSSAPVQVRGNVFYRNGRMEIPAVPLGGSAGLAHHVADIVVGDGGHVDVRVQP